MKNDLFAAALAVVASSGAATAATVDFSSLAGASQLTSFDFGDGLTGTARAEGNRANNPNAAVVFDTSILESEDPDIQSPFALAGSTDRTQERRFGNAIIVQENQAVNGVFLPDDDGTGGFIEFAFDNAVTLDRVFLLDTVVGASVTLFDQGVLVGSLSTVLDADTGNNPNNNLYTFLDFDGAQGDRFVVDFNGKSGAIGEFEATLAAVPLPASLPLLLAGFGALGLMRRRTQHS